MTGLAGRNRIGEVGWENPGSPSFPPFTHTLTLSLFSYLPPDLPSPSPAQSCFHVVEYARTYKTNKERKQVYRCTVAGTGTAVAAGDWTASRAATTAPQSYGMQADDTVTFTYSLRKHVSYSSWGPERERKQAMTAVCLSCPAKSSSQPLTVRIFAHAWGLHRPDPERAWDLHRRPWRIWLRSFGYEVGR